MLLESDIESCGSIPPHPIRKTATNISLARLRYNFVFEIIVFKFKVNFVFSCLGLESSATSPSCKRYFHFSKIQHKMITKC